MLKVINFSVIRLKKKINYDDKNQPRISTYFQLSQAPCTHKVKQVIKTGKWCCCSYLQSLGLRKLHLLLHLPWLLEPSFLPISNNLN